MSCEHAFDYDELVAGLRDDNKLTTGQFEEHKPIDDDLFVTQFEEYVPEDYDNFCYDESESLFHITLPSETYVPIKIRRPRKRPIERKTFNTGFGAFCRLYGLYILSRGTIPYTAYNINIDRKSQLITATIDTNNNLVLTINSVYDAACHAYTNYGCTAKKPKSQSTIYRWWSSSNTFQCNDVSVHANQPKSGKTPTHIDRVVKLPDVIIDYCKAGPILEKLRDILFYIICKVIKTEYWPSIHTDGVGKIKFANDRMHKEKLTIDMIQSYSDISNILS